MSAEKHVNTKDTDRPLEISQDNLDSAIFIRGVGVGLTHTENLMIMKVREVRETDGLELDQEEAEGEIPRQNFGIPNEYSENILITDSNFILSDRTSAICITADKSFNTRLKADFKRE